MNKNTRKNHSRKNHSRKNHSRKNHSRKNKIQIQKGGDWGTFFFGSIFGASVLKWLESPIRSKQVGGKKNKNNKTRKNNI